MTTRTAAVFSMPLEGHFQRLRPIISGLDDRGITPVVFTDRSFEPRVKAAGGTFVDLFAGRPLESADATSEPFPCRFVSFAGRFADAVAREAAAVRPELVVYDMFSVIGRVVATQLGLPYVNVCAGHNVDPARFVAALHTDPRVAVSPACDAAVTALRDRYGIADASPFSYVAGLSPFLNVYSEPERYLTPAERRVFEPIAFFGSLPPAAELAKRDEGADSLFDGDVGLRIYVSFGTVTWRYYRSQALDALRAISSAIARRAGAAALVSLGGAEVSTEELRGIATPSVRVLPYVDQWRVLSEADVFVTHHGMSSTHEAIFNLVPMIGYPFFWDQPSLARKCEEFGVSVPLTTQAMGAVSSDDVDAALDAVFERRSEMCDSLAQARAWELDVVAQRDAVIDRIAELA